MRETSRLCREACGSSRCRAAGSVVALSVVDRATVQPDTPPTPTQRVRQALAQLQEPAPVQQLQKLCGIRTATVCSALAQLSASGEVVRDARGYQLKLPFPVSRPIDPEGNGNGKWATANLNQEPQFASAED